MGISFNKLFLYARTKLELVKKVRNCFVGGKVENAFQLGFLLAKSILYGEIQCKNLAHSTFGGDIAQLINYLVNQTAQSISHMLFTPPILFCTLIMYLSQKDLFYTLK